MSDEPQTAPRVKKKKAAAGRQKADFMLAQEEWPQIDRALVDFLERCFPPRSMKPGESIEEAMFHSGKVALVEAIRSAHEIQRSGG